MSNRASTRRIVLKRHFFTLGLVSAGLYRGKSSHVTVSTEKQNTSSVQTQNQSRTYVQLLAGDWVLVPVFNSQSFTGFEKGSGYQAIVAKKIQTKLSKLFVRQFVKSGFK